MAFPSCSDAAPEIFAWLRLDGIHHLRSRRAEELVGRPPDELIGTPGPELFDDVDRPEIERKLAGLAIGPVGEQDRITVRMRQAGRNPGLGRRPRLASPKTRRPASSGSPRSSRESGDRVETERALAGSRTASGR